jgi:formylglycine-generating enzyme required for sulfatase activity
MSRILTALMVLCAAVICSGCRKTAPVAEDREIRSQVSGKKAGDSGPDLSIMVKIPAGNFWMGCSPELDRSCQADEKPGHRVFLNEFWIDRTEVTVAQYAECFNAGSCNKPAAWENCNWGKKGRGRAPVNCVDWLQARAFCQWAGKRLPSEAEWEKAARGTDGRKFPWGNRGQGCKYAVMAQRGKGCGIKSAWPVCSKPSGNSPYGLCDMLGNVPEWVNDWYQNDYYGFAPVKNPAGPETGKERVVRGGSWYMSPVLLGASRRQAVFPDGGAIDEGFRCAWSGGDK